MEQNSVFPIPNWITPFQKNEIIRISTPTKIRLKISLFLSHQIIDAYISFISLSIHSESKMFSLSIIYRFVEIETLYYLPWVKTNLSTFQ